ncbi:MAG: ABC transporter ATP-binding protein [Bifidobacteriaceae bacterium]|jgi:ABC-type lipoprotein export system ATPase subunit|nr:ABC transporter ATP-binding protein [Bifidobacteriaceae bacterium]MCI1978722.1 ABC transporter ATP-binding protein [Bifidobacteriaceae bacterium]
MATNEAGAAPESPVVSARSAVAENEAGAVPIVAVEALTKTFPPTTHALTDVSFEILLGQSVAIIGKSGSGKSTLLSILGLLETPTSGTYRFAGTDTQGLPSRRLTAFRRDSIGYIFQAYNLVEYLTVRENVLHALDIKGIRGEQAERIAEEKIARVGLEERRDAYPQTLSGGEQQRTAIARAIAGAPQLLLCNEPTGNLDERTAASILDLLLSMVSPTNAVVIVTHDSSVAAACQRRLVMSDGVLTEQISGSDSGIDDGTDEESA